MASSRPILPVVGNHEYYLYHSTKNFRTFFPYSFPGRKSVYYSKDIGSVHIIFLDSYDDGFAGMSSNTSSKQMEWLTGDLADAEARGAGWIFVILHQSVISNGEYPGDVKLQKLLLPVLAKFNVDAVFWGHAHLYEHWHYQYGKNGYLLNPRDLPGKSPIDFFCIGSSGASLESNYRLFTHKNFKRNKPEWFSVKEGRHRRKTSVQYPWNRKLFLEGITDRHYYNFPFNESGNYSGDSKISYNTENEWFGYQYGENTLHYAKVVIKNNLCTISIHYPDGSLLKGPGDALSQKFYLRKKRG
ncbi:MAG: metallophosphoesterase [Spirochaetales bacterium]|nr:metallophosphoesterase [Spirochaetales bacterium]